MASVCSTIAQMYRPKLMRVIRPMRKRQMDSQSHQRVHFPICRLLKVPMTTQLRQRWWIGVGMSATSTSIPPAHGKSLMRRQTTRPRSVRILAATRFSIRNDCCRAVYGGSCCQLHRLLFCPVRSGMATDFVYGYLHNSKSAQVASNVSYAGFRGSHPQKCHTA